MGDVIDNLSFPLVSCDWNADEEILLLEAIVTYGFGNWKEVVNYVGSKTQAECIDYFNSACMQSPCFPLPDLSRTNGKSKDERLAKSKEHVVKIETTALLMNLSPKEELPMSAEIKYVTTSVPCAIFPCLDLMLSLQIGSLLIVWS
ncbi:Transcriptional adapter ADA2a [Raphanus sativus]|nr:Transcriptional adapter ADA2a [Raphanus sativus]